LVGYFERIEIFFSIENKKPRKRINIFFSNENKKLLTFETTREMKKYVLTAKSIPRTRKTEVGKFEKAE
jgi:hypothetical protein